jgi:hypothetical protein
MIRQSGKKVYRVLYRTITETFRYACVPDRLGEGSCRGPRAIPIYFKPHHTRLKLNRPTSASTSSDTYLHSTSIPKLFETFSWQKQVWSNKLGNGSRGVTWSDWDTVLVSMIFEPLSGQRHGISCTRCTTAAGSVNLKTFTVTLQKAEAAAFYFQSVLISSRSFSSILKSFDQIKSASVVTWVDMAPACDLAVDQTFGPAVQCPDQFDFTLFFEQAIFGIGFSGLFLLIVPFRVYHLWGATIKCSKSPIYAAKIV